MPVNALWLVNGMIQLFLLITLFSQGTYLSLIYLASSMILVPYLWSAVYALLLALCSETYEDLAGLRRSIWPSACWQWATRSGCCMPAGSST